MVAFEPVNRLESAMAEALAAGDQETYLHLLAGADLVVPIVADGHQDPDQHAGPEGGSGRPGWATTRHNDAVYLVAYTSEAAMLQSTGGQFGRSRGLSFAELAAAWPDPEWWLVVNPGLPLAAHLPTSLVRQLAGGEFTAPSEPPPAPDTPAAAADEPDGPTVMQKVVPPGHVSYYLDKGYDWVAGYVHRWADVADLTVPDIVRHLGLTYPGSPFSAEDDSVFVIRWTAYRAELYRTPVGGSDPATMRAAPGGWVVEEPPFTGTGFAPHPDRSIPEYKIESIRLPHQSEMWRIDRTGEQHFVAVYDGTDQCWLVNRQLLANRRVDA